MVDGASNTALLEDKEGISGSLMSLGKSSMELMSNLQKRKEKGL